MRRLNYKCRHGLIFICYGFSAKTITLTSTASIARTPVARLPWLIRTRFLSPCEILLIAQESKCLGKFSYFIMKLYFVSYRGDSNEYTQLTIFV